MNGSDDSSRRRLVAGIGCTSNATGDEVLALVRSALAQARGRPIALGTIARRDGHAALIAVATALGLPLRIIDLPGPEVAEPVAASAGAIVLEKRKSAHATCALASVPAGFDPDSWGQPSSSAAIASGTVATSTAGP